MIHMSSSPSRKPEDKGKQIARALTISELERASGVPRSTIHYYIREGLLPQPQKTAGTRALYSEHHLLLLEEIQDAKAAGRSLSEIRADLQARIRELRENSIDLEAQEYDRNHQAILRFAIKKLMREGYRRTHVADLTRDLGISSSVFYTHFPSKRHLLVECFRTFIDLSIAHIEPRAAESGDLVERMLARVSARLALYPLGADLLALVSSEMLQGEADLRKTVNDAWDSVIKIIVGELAAMTSADAPAPPVPTVLLAYSVDEALQGTITRALWDSSISRVDLVRTHIWLWLAIRAALSGQVDINSELAQYEDLIQEVAAAAPLVVPGLE
jgi:DNA-binding transcriptional MerR regulator